MITTDRDVFVGAHVEPWVKNALVEEAKLKQCSVSKLISDILVDHLKGKGYNESTSD